MPGPKLRRLDRYTLDRDGEPHIILHDPLALSEPVALPALAAAVLDLLDGQRSPAQIRHSLLLRGEADIDTASIAELVDDLGEAGLLDDDRFRRRWAAALAEFRGAPARAPRFADLLYPGDPAALHEHLDALLGAPDALVTADSPVVGVVVPHQPFAAVGALLRATLRELPRAEDIDLVVVLGTDHHAGLTPYALTDRSHATPLGPVAVDEDLVGRLSRRLEWLRQEEIRHRSALSTELAVVLLRYLYGDRTPPILPLLCGQSALLVGDTSAAAEDFLAACEQLLEGRRVLWWTVAELHHAGPAYGRPALEDDAIRKLQAADHRLLEPLLAGHPRELERRCLTEDPLFGQASGAAALVTLARLLPLGLRGELCHYTAEPAAGESPGLFGAAGLRFLDRGRLDVP